MSVFDKEKPANQGLSERGIQWVESMRRQQTATSVNEKSSCSRKMVA